MIRSISPATVLFCGLALAGCSTLGLGDASPSTGLAPSAEVRQAQLVLQQQGSYTGKVDGLPGPATQAAVQLYQQSHGLEASGAVDPATARSLNLGAAPAVETTRTQMADGSRISEADARKLIESQGFTGVNGLYQDDSAVWRGVGTRRGKSGEVAIDALGQVVTN